MAMLCKRLAISVMAAVVVVTGTAWAHRAPSAAPHMRGGQGFHAASPRFGRFDRREDRFERRFPFGRFDRREDRFENRFFFRQFDRREDRFERRFPFGHFDRREDRFENRFFNRQFDRFEDRFERRFPFGRFDRREDRLENRIPVRRLDPGDGRRPVGSLSGSRTTRLLTGPYAAYGEKLGWSVTSADRPPPGKSPAPSLSSRPVPFTFAAYGE